MAASATVEKVRQATRAFRFVNLVVGFAAVCWIIVAAATGFGQKDTLDRMEQAAGRTARVDQHGLTRDVVGTMGVVGIIVTPLLLALGAHRLARSIDSASPVLWAVLSALGCLGVLVVVLLCNQAIKWFSNQGLKVGLLGPTRPSLAALEKAQGPPRA